MTLPKGWTIELGRLAAIFLVASILSLLVFSFTTWLIILLLGYCCWHLLNAYRLYAWLTNPDKAPIPHSHGIWDSLFHLSYKTHHSYVAEHRRMQRQFDRFEQSATALPDATVILNKKNHIEWLNEAAERLLGLRRPYDYGQRINNLIRHPAYISYLESEDYDKIVEIPSPIESNIMLRVRMVTFGNQQKLLLARNVSRLYQLEQMRRDFIANVSHELRTPLTVIIGFIENLQNLLPKNKSEWEQPITLMQEQSARMLRIIDDLLFLSKLETNTTSGKKSNVDVAALITEISNEARAYPSFQEHKFVLDIDNKLLLKGEANELRSAFSNLVVNAVKYTPAAGKIKLHWYNTSAGPTFEIEDNGIGIPAKHIPRLTERFYRVDVSRSREHGGTGLGLAIVKHVLIRHNATLEIRSEPGKGSKFTCQFPPSMAIINSSDNLSPTQNPMAPR